MEKIQDQHNISKSESTVNKWYEFYLLFYFGINIKMAKYQNLKVKLSDSQLDKLKSATKKRLV